MNKKLSKEIISVFWKVLKKISFAIFLFLPTYQTASAGQGITIVVPYGVGGTQDLVLRTFSEELSATLNEPVIVRNMPGAGGTIGAAFVARSNSDGKIFLFASNSHLASNSLYSNLSYDPRTDFVGVAIVAQGGLFLSIPTYLNTETLTDYISLIRANPNKYNYASGGNGSATHLAMSYFLSQFELNMQQIPMKSTSESLLELLAGRVQGAMFAPNTVASNQERSEIKFIAYTGKYRNKFFPKIQTVAQLTNTNFYVEDWVGLLAPKNTPSVQIERLNQAVQKVLSRPGVISKFEAMGLSVSSKSVDEFNQILDSETKKINKSLNVIHSK